MPYRVAVIENESESIHYGYANITPKLKSLHLSNYEFERFDSQNINTLFRDVDGEKKYLLTFDGLFICTNATSDSDTLNTLRINKEIIEKFISLGKGIYLSYQKKLELKPDDIHNPTGFLPQELEIYSVSRPEESSGEGEVSIKKTFDTQINTINIILHYPEKITAKEIMRVCQNNDFKKHLYRVYLQSVNQAYHTLVYDKKYDNKEEERPLILVNRQSGISGRIVISAIPLDWEWHLKLLTNIVKYVSEGLPSVALISGATPTTEDFKDLISRTTLSKIPFASYSSYKEIPSELIGMHGIYVFSTECSENEVAEFWDTIDSTKEHLHFNYKQLYKINKDVNGKYFLIKRSNYTSTDLTIDKAFTWLDRKYKNKMWNGGWWNTFDVFSMMIALDIDCEKYIQGVFADIQGENIESDNKKNHYKHGSYDGVIGATCGLLELGISLVQAHPDAMQKVHFDHYRLQEIANWILNQYDKHHINDRRYAIIVLTKYSELIKEKKIQWKMEDKYYEMLNKYEELLIKFEKEHEIENYIDVSRAINLAISVGATKETIRNLFDRLLKNQEKNGSWDDNIRRTAHIVVNLMTSYGDLKKNLIDNTVQTTYLNELLYKAILYLRSTYNEETGNWNDNIQTTAKSAQAIGMHNKKFGYAQHELFETLQREIKHIDNSNMMREIRSELSLYRNNLTKAYSEIKQINNKIQKINRKDKKLFYCLIVIITIYMCIIVWQFTTILPDKINSLIATVLTIVLGIIGIGIPLRSILTKRLESDHGEK